MEKVGSENTIAKSKSALNPDDYNKVVQAADLLDVKLTKSSFDIQPFFFSATEGEKRFLYACEPRSAHYDPETKLLFGAFVLEAGVKSGRKWLLKVQAHYLTIYTVEGEPAADAAIEFARRVGKFTCYPYFRAHYAGLASSAGAEVPPLPVLRGNTPRTIKRGNEEA